MDKAKIINRIKLMLGFTEQQYNQMMYETGEEYFAFKCLDYPAILQSFRESKVMWAWWKNQYLIIDEAIAGRENKLTIEMYRAIHLGLEYYPNEVIVKKALHEYSKAIQTEVKSKINT